MQAHQGNNHSLQSVHAARPLHFHLQGKESSHGGPAASCQPTQSPHEPLKGGGRDPAAMENGRPATLKPGSTPSAVLAAAASPARAEPPSTPRQQGHVAGKSRCVSACACADLGRVKPPGEEFRCRGGHWLLGVSACGLASTCAGICGLHLHAHFLIAPPPALFFEMPEYLGPAPGCLPAPHIIICSQMQRMLGLWSPPFLHVRGGRARTLCVLNQPRPVASSPTQAVRHAQHARRGRCHHPHRRR